MLALRQYKLRRCCISLFCAAIIGAFFWGAHPDPAWSEDYGESLLDIVPPELMEKEIPFTEEELARYLADYKTAKPMTDTEADKFFSAQGWSEERLIYITVKIAVGLDVLQNGDNSPLLQNVPKIMFPTKAERKLIKAHSAEIEEIFIVGH